MKTRKTSLLLSLLLVLATSPMFAHHSTRGIYEETEIEITGKVLSWRFINPHPYLTIEAEDENGTLQEWDVSYGGAAVVHLTRQGYTDSTFKEGDIIVVKGRPARAESVFGILIEGGHPTWPDGSSVVEGGSMF